MGLIIGAEFCGSLIRNREDVPVVGDCTPFANTSSRKLVLVLQSVPPFRLAGFVTEWHEWACLLHTVWHNGTAFEKIGQGYPVLARETFAAVGVDPTSLLPYHLYLAAYCTVLLYSTMRSRNLSIESRLEQRMRAARGSKR